jgi:2,3-diketo-5-methylthio-1-phosphopentane phosphatase
MAPIAITPPAIEVKSFETMKPLKTTTSKRRDIICFSDFDGTIFMQDTGHILFNNFGCGSERRKVLDQQIHNGERSFRDVSEEMWGSLNVPFEEGFEAMKHALEIDIDFETFHQFCIKNGIPFNVISAGLKPVLRRVLDHFLGEEASKHIDIVANDATISPCGSRWKPIWLHDTELGHDKAKSINDFKDQARSEGEVPLIVFIGDGVSDLPAAREADVLFARRGLRLEEYCIENNLSYIPYDTFADIQREVAKLANIEEQPRKPSLFTVIPPVEEKASVWTDALNQLKTPLDGPRLEALDQATIAAPAA